MPENQIKKKVEELVLGLSKAVQIQIMYTGEHKLTIEAIDKLYEILTDTLAEKVEITIGIIGDEIAFEKEPYYETSQKIRDFIDHLKEIDVKKISFERGIRRDELAEFNSILAMDAKALEKTKGIEKLFVSSNVEHIAIGEIGFRAKPQVEIKPEDMTKEQYDQAAKFLTQAFKRTKGHQPLNVQSARQIVGGMVDNLLKNRSLLLILTSIKSQSESTFAHGVNTAVFTLMQAEALGLEQKYLNDIGMAALLHDSGKISGDDLDKKTEEELSEEDKKKISDQDIKGAKALLDTPGISALAAIVAFEHNMHYDMSGPTKKIYGKGLNLVSMMISISEYYDRLKRRPEYQKAGGPEKIYEDMMKLSGKKFHPDLLENFFSLIGLYPPGTLVELDSKEIALVIQPSALDIRRPQVEILYDEKGEKYKEPRIANLMEKDKKGKFKYTVLKSVSPLEKFEVPKKYS
ncbi:MAG: HD-GYP domain-containing protein [Candidatus Omnitrophota bacterium]